MYTPPLDAHVVEFRQASKRQRMLNFSLDLLGYYSAILILGLLGLPDLIDWVFHRNKLKLYNAELVALYVSVILLYVIYYSLLEYYCKGKTLGKWVTKTRVVTQDGHPLDIFTVFQRNLLRYNPLDPLSYLVGLNWHDEWSSTVVIDERPTTDSKSTTP